MRILVSGAAGLIGGELVARLAGAGHAVTALVHRETEIRANDGALVPSSLLRGKPPEAGEVVHIKADVSLGGLGLDEATCVALCAAHDLIIHCAAVIAFDADPDLLDRVNVGGTANMLAAFPGMPFLHVSTAYVCGLKDGPIPESPRDAGFGFSNHYERSKAAGEALVTVERGRAWAIARPSIVVGKQGCGTIRHFDTIYGAFRLMAEGRITTLPTRRSASLDLVPIDHVVGGLLDMVAGWDRAAGKIIHLSAEAAVPIPELVAAMATFPQFSLPNLVEADAFDPDRLANAERRLYARVMRHYAGYFTRNPQFEATELRALSGRVCPPVDKDALIRMMGFAVARGFLRAEIEALAG